VRRPADGILLPIVAPKTVRRFRLKGQLEGNVTTVCTNDVVSKLPLLNFFYAILMLIVDP